MSKTFLNEQYLTDIANAIRFKTGESIGYYPSEMASAIMRISSTEGVKCLQAMPVNEDWKFHLISPVADTSYSSITEAQPNYDDSDWQSVRIPHDWSIERDFNPDSLSGYPGGFLDGGDGWYRKKYHTCLI